MKDMKILILLAVFVILINITSCTQNQRAKSFGGTATVMLAPNQKLVIATWKGENLWYLTRPMKKGEKAETYTFKEESNFGIASGTVIFKESK